VSRAAGLLGACMGPFLAAACEPAPPPPVSLGAMSVDRPQPPADAAAPPPGRCPQDAPWNGRVCLGMGYVACPGEGRLDDAGACASPPRDAGGDR
jgi:hypothetical protein